MRLSQQEDDEITLPTSVDEQNTNNKTYNSDGDGDGDAMMNNDNEDIADNKVNDDRNTNINGTL